MEQYSAYTNEGTPWGLQFPAHWTRAKLGRVTSKIGSGATPKGGKTVYLDAGKTSLIRSLNVYDEGFRHTDLAYIDDESARQLDSVSVCDGDVLLNITGASILRSVIAPPDVLPARVNQHVSILRPTREVSAGYLHAWLISPQMRRYMYSQSVGSTREAITKSQLQSFPIMLPPTIEQDAIVSYLDSKTAEIDGVVGRLRRQRELLERYKRELIAHTVTRGLNPDAPMKDRGLEWLGEIPEHWQIQTLSNMTDENKTKNKDLAERNLLSLSYGQIIRKDIDLAFGLLPASFDSYQIIEPGYVVLRMTDLQNDKRSLRSGYVQERGIITSAYVSLIPRPQVSSGFLAWLLRTYDLKKVFYSLGSGVRQSLNYSELRTLPTLLPPLDEQQAIAAYLDEKTAEIDDLVADLDRQVELLQKYRKQLINDVVTGKVRVCEEGE